MSASAHFHSLKVRAQGKDWHINTQRQLEIIQVIFVTPEEKKNKQALHETPAFFLQMKGESQGHEKIYRFVGCDITSLHALKLGRVRRNLA